MPTTKAEARHESIISAYIEMVIDHKQNKS